MSCFSFLHPLAHIFDIIVRMGYFVWLFGRIITLLKIMVISERFENIGVNCNISITNSIIRRWMLTSTTFANGCKKGFLLKDM